MLLSSVFCDGCVSMQPARCSFPGFHESSTSAGPSVPSDANTETEDGGVADGGVAPAAQMSDGGGVTNTFGL